LADYITEMVSLEDLKPVGQIHSRTWTKIKNTEQTIPWSNFLEPKVWVDAKFSGVRKQAFREHLGPQVKSQKLTTGVLQWLWELEFEMGSKAKTVVLGGCARLRPGPCSAFW
jgi:hypothetical protein